MVVQKRDLLPNELTLLCRKSEMTSASSLRCSSKRIKVTATWKRLVLIRLRNEVAAEFEKMEPLPY